MHTKYICIAFVYLVTKKQGKVPGFQKDDDDDDAILQTCAGADLVSGTLLRIWELSHDYA